MDRVLSNGDVSEFVFFGILRDYEDLNKRKAKLASDEKTLRKRAKDDGVNLNDLKQVLRERALTVDEQVQAHNRRLAYRRFLKMPASAQMTFIDESLSDETGLTPEQREQKWQDIGFVAGREGKSLTDVMQGVDPNSEIGRWITTGWEAGQEENAKGIKQKARAPRVLEDKKPAEANGDPAPAEADAPSNVTPARRGRPPKDGLVYYHDEFDKKLYVLKKGETPPQGAVNITRAQHAELEAKYAAEPPKPEDDSFDSPAEGAA